MGNKNSHPASPSGLSERPRDITQVNESVWELHGPEGPPAVDVIFFHGLQVSDYREAFWKTWLSRDGTVVWPKEWLAPALRNARILSISYDSSARIGSRSGVTEMYQIIENLMSNIVLSPSHNIGQNCKVILVGHSLGGLIIKQLLLKCRSTEGLLDPKNPTEASQIERIKTFINNCSGILYYSTPHAGSELAAYAALADRIPGANVNMEIINFLKVLSNDTARINNDFSRMRHMLQVTTRGIGELRQTTFAGLTRFVVPEASARMDVDLYYSAQANHFEVCKAENNSFSNIFTSLRDLCGIWTEVVPRAELYQLQ